MAVSAARRAMRVLAVAILLLPLLASPGLASGVCPVALAEDEVTDVVGVPEPVTPLPGRGACVPAWAADVPVHAYAGAVTCTFPADDTVDACYFACVPGRSLWVVLETAAGAEQHLGVYQVEVEGCGAVLACHELVADAVQRDLPGGRASFGCRFGSHVNAAGLGSISLTAAPWNAPPALVSGGNA